MTGDIVAQLDPIFKPRSIAIIGASDVPGRWGYRTLLRPLSTGYRGTIYPVHPSKKVIMGLPAFASVLDIPDPVDLAVIVIPASAVPRVMEECVQKGIKGGVIITAGFAETGPEGKDLQDRVVAIAAKGGLRFVGPNGMGIFSSAVNLNLSFERAPLSGPIAFISQSGTFGGYLAETAIDRGYGLSKFISIGNQADLDAADYLEYLMEEDDTKAIVLYMEGLRDGRRFFQVARETVRRKPVIIYKAGRTQAGARATQSHTASLAGEDRVFEALCRQTGILRADEVLQPFDMAEALAHQPLPKGRRVGILGSGGQGVVTSDACSLLGLEVPEFDPEAQAQFKKELPPHAPAPRNPLDFAGGTRTAQEEAQMADRMASIPYIDGIITNVPVRAFIPGGPEEQLRDSMEACHILTSIPERYGKPVILLHWHAARSGAVVAAVDELIKAAGIPGYDTPEQCARAMLALARYGEIRRQI